jgi:hypothetical protein
MKKESTAKDEPGKPKKDLESRQNAGELGKISKETVRQMAVEDEKIISVIRALIRQDENGQSFH